MPISINEYNALKKEAERLKAGADRAEGALEQQKKRLREEFGCESILEAEKLLKKLEREEAQLEEDYQLKKEQFQEKWKDRLNL